MPATPLPLRQMRGLWFSETHVDPRTVFRSAAGIETVRPRVCAVTKSIQMKKTNKPKKDRHEKLSDARVRLQIALERSKADGRQTRLNEELVEAIDYVAFQVGLALYEIETLMVEMGEVKGKG